MNFFQPLRDTLKDLPVHSIIADVVKDVHVGAVTVVAARTGSGKSMMLPSALADAGLTQVVVLVPRRFLATDAACNVAELSGTTLGQEVGFALGQVNDEKSLHVPDTKLLFCTYGYALRSGELAADCIVAALSHQQVTAAELGRFLPAYLTGLGRLRRGLWRGRQAR